MRKLIVLFTIGLACALACGCRCRSDLGEEEGSKAPVASSAVSSDDQVNRWCRACALRNFLSCKRETGTGTEAEIRRKAELAACRDIGFAPEQCTEDRIRFVDCGVED
ncbi:MAG: hypothetical protein ABIJ56_23830 [Pseudomonadota bacterium]